MPLRHAGLVDLQSLGHLDLAPEVLDCVLCFHASIMPVVICLCSLFFSKSRQRSMHISYQGAKHMNWGFFMQSTGTRVKALRVSKRLNQQQLADAVGVTQPAIAKIETGKTKELSGRVLEALARELASTPSYILHGAQDSDDHEHSMIPAEMAAIFRVLSLSDKEVIIRVARTLVSEKQPKKSPVA